MSFQTLTQYRLICDRCAGQLADYGTREFHHKATALTAARKRGWLVTDDGHAHLCPNCRASVPAPAEAATTP